MAGGAHDGQQRMNDRRQPGGWLLLLCIALTIAGPASTAYTLVTAARDASPYFAQFPGLRTVTIVDAVLSMGLMAFSVYAGLLLWRVRPGALRIARLYFLAFLGYHVIAAALPFMAGLPAEANPAMISVVGWSTARSAVYFAVWYTYLARSKRVAETYAS